MKVIETKLKGCFIIEPTIFEDIRGYFYESFNKSKFEALTGMSSEFVQDNQSKSLYGVVRGLHQQLGEYAQAKLVRVLEGKVLDVAVDVREGSTTYGEHVAVELSAENNKQMYIPRGFLHGFAVLSKTATFFYKCDNQYNKEAEDGVHPLDATLAIDWTLPQEHIILSEKDKVARPFQ
ncbi:dTDP-4-dehydrorhamnose 3,5-epimerase [Sphingobacterium alimentarium]|uniref:dTDP-4-dehydrorhamnose 3,5-epimerase n=1 Tax=Sphingobacterium alimentarium TaxID=797292 RepID=A0A4R3VUW9_9SPHI|nr:dTDP-4-dehydrorhamnose 3,5-epimerase [Sphingobacterium alimentarium]TCV10458.1 dTDP-4-dehydrorhamnose 3,5-epimerase [Sphingobacterium alimentarium]